MLPDNEVLVCEWPRAVRVRTQWIIQRHAVHRIDKIRREGPPADVDEGRYHAPFKELTAAVKISLRSRHRFEAESQARGRWARARR